MYGALSKVQHRFGWMQDDKNLNRLMKDKYTPKGTRLMISDFDPKNV